LLSHVSILFDYTVQRRSILHFTLNGETFAQLLTMLTEQFIASVGVPNKAPGTNVSKDAAIFTYQFQPLLVQQQVFKKSATPSNCLAVSSTYIFAAQSEKAVIHVYSRDKGNQEAIVPFTERITCLTLACDETVLVLGTAEGRIFLWEIASGRQISTSQAHLQAVTALALDGTGNFLLSASKDSTTHVWTIPSLLSFANTDVQPFSPLRTFTSHRADVTAIVLGRATGFANLAVSASSDKTCLVWDYHTNAVLRTYLLPAAPTCLEIDAAERAVYVGYEDGCIQQLDLYASISGSANVHDISKRGHAPIQPPHSSLWLPLEKSAGAVTSISISFDGCTILSGHANGAILSWDVGKSGLSCSILQAPLPGPVANLMFLPVAGFAKDQRQNLKIAAIVKPKFGAFDDSSGTVPNNYAVNVELARDLVRGEPSDFEVALTSSCFSGELLDDGLNELLNLGKGGHSNNAVEQEDAEDFMALDESTGPRTLSLEEQNSALNAELNALRRLQRASFEKIEKISSDKRALIQGEQKRLATQNGLAPTARTNGAIDGDLNVDYSSSSE
jgi:pre-rRNA-processing protein IPI3